jgi:serine/threonine-protein kinase
MSPEQAARGTLDHRSDQYSFGAIVYEMLTGRPVSERDPASGTSEWRTSSIEASIGAIVDRCLRANPDERYRSTRDLALAVRQIREDTLHGGPRRFTRRQIFAAGAVAATAVAAVLWRRPFGTGAPRRLAVLPFVNISGDPNTEILSDGITDVLIGQLSHSRNLEVIGKTTAFSLKGKPQDPLQVGRLLDVDEVLTGSLTVRGGRAVVEVELVDARTGSRVWGDKLDRPELDVLAIQNVIAAAIITRGLPAEADATLRELSRGLTSNREAYLRFLQAVHHIRLDQEADYLAARRLLAEVVQRDERFALAHLTLASTYSVAAVDGFERPVTAWEQSHQHVERALNLDPDLPDAHAERAIELFFYRRDWARAQHEWDIALQSRRGELQGELLSAYVLQLWALGRFKEALHFAQAARSVDPLSPYLAVREADMLAATGDVSSAVKRYKAVIDSASGHPVAAHLGLAQLERSQHRFDDAIQSFRTAFAETDDEELTKILAVARGEDGCRAIDRYLARYELAALSARESAGQYVSPLGLARAHARLAATEQAFKFLNTAFEEHAAGLVFLNVDPAWDNIRHDRLFDATVRRVGLPQTGQRG